MMTQVTGPLLPMETWMELPLPASVVVPMREVDQQVKSSVFQINSSLFFNF